MDASSCIRVCPVKLLLCNLTAFGSPALVAPQPLPSELLGPAHRGGVSCVYIIGTAITHGQDTPKGSQIKKSTHRQVFYYSIVILLPPSPSCYNWTFPVAWLLSTTVTLCHPPSSLTRNHFQAHSEVSSTVGDPYVHCSWQDSWTLPLVWLAVTGSLLISFAFEDVEDIRTQVTVNLFFPLVLWWFVNF